MSQDLLDIVQHMDQQGLEWQMAMQCAPLITGLKVSNLVMLPASCERDILDFLSATEFSYQILRRTEKKIAMLIYRAEDLIRVLASPEACRILADAGYPSSCLPGKDHAPDSPQALRALQAALCLLGRRYRDCREKGQPFPHEMGLFLGYPVEDVQGFIEKRPALYSGYWVVFEQVEEKKKLFSAYEEARSSLIRLLHEGWTLVEILQQHSSTRSSSRLLPAAG